MSNRPNELHRQHLKNLMYLLSDEHTEVARQANVASGHFIRLNDLDPDTTTTTTRDAHTKRVQWSLGALEDLLSAQALRVVRMRAEVTEMKKNIETA